MRILNVTVRNKIATGDGKVVICDNSDYVVRFDLDEEWNEHEIRTMRIVFANDEALEIVFTGNECSLPIIVNKTGFLIGIYAGNLHTTVGAWYDCEKSILSTGEQHEPPSQDVYNQLVELIESGAVKGDTGNGIESIEKTGTSGLVDTYTITFTDGTTTTYQITNGEKGEKGDTGDTPDMSPLIPVCAMQSINKTSHDGRTVYQGTCNTALDDMFSALAQGKQVIACVVGVQGFINFINLTAMVGTGSDPASVRPAAFTGELNSVDISGSGDNKTYNENRITLYIDNFGVYCYAGTIS